MLIQNLLILRHPSQSFTPGDHLIMTQPYEAVTASVLGSGMRLQCKRSKQLASKSLPGSPSRQPAQSPCPNTLPFSFFLPNDACLPFHSQGPCPMSPQCKEHWKPFYTDPFPFFSPSSTFSAPAYSLLATPPKSLPLGDTLICSESV